MLKVASFFAGIGGFDLGLEKAGMQVVFQCEIDHFCRSVLRKHWPQTQIFDDILSLDPKDIPDVDVWCGGFPCQDLSLANQGKRKGLKGERSGLFVKFAELIQKKKPRWVIIENVPGLLNSNEGKDFQTLLRSLDELGYGISWRVFDAKYFGTPQRRRRVFIVASLGSIGSYEILFENRSTKISFETGLGEKDFIAKGVCESNSTSNIYTIQHAAISRKPEAGPQAKGYRNDGKTFTLDSRGCADAVCKTDDAFRVRDTSGISERVDRRRYRAIGNAVCVNIVTWLGKRIVDFEKKQEKDKKRQLFSEKAHSASRL